MKGKMKPKPRLMKQITSRMTLARMQRHFIFIHKTVPHTCSEVVVCVRTSRFQRENPCFSFAGCRNGSKPAGRPDPHLLLNMQHLGLRKTSNLTSLAKAGQQAKESELSLDQPCINLIGTEQWSWGDCHSLLFNVASL